ncbi:MAG: glycoside hydrolase family 88 protein [Candidatus Marinimicrobia bacterium]|nr:glycoside hydrolase family 88 protein [Candidatus Neomarinimicrobiota bacterium]MCF7828210.1 glycoside hydrolase family 88 protein [Candidatus Neomarinimicrobiota bacterium]MCF7879615.1 glycoside hydrolase family 88 protein [Candidatus Neomarinimicrobiota bacterium]
MHLVWILAILVCTGSVVDAQELPDKRDVLEDMILANGYFMNKWPDPGDSVTTNKTRPSHLWTRAVYYEGLMALYEIYPREEYYDYAVAWGESHEWGLWGGPTTRNADNQCCGQTYIDLYTKDPEEVKRIRKLKASMDMMVNTPQNDDWWWIDAIQMAMPVFAKLGVLYNDDSYFEKMYDIYMYTKTEHGDNGLYNPEDGLWWRDADFDPPYTEPNGEDCYWSRGNGWVFAGLARVLDVIPEDAPHREEYVKTFKEMAAAIKAVQRDDGFWNVSLHDPNHYGGKETTGTSLFTFGFAWGVNNGILAEEEYLKTALDGWNALATESLHDNGFLGYVQSTGKQPSAGQPVTYDSVPDFEDYGLGCFLMAGSEIYKLQ